VKRPRLLVGEVLEQAADQVGQAAHQIGRRELVGAVVGQVVGDPADRVDVQRPAGRLGDQLGDQAVIHRPAGLGAALPEQGGGVLVGQASQEVLAGLLGAARHQAGPALGAGHPQPDPPRIVPVDLAAAGDHEQRVRQPPDQMVEDRFGAARVVILDPFERVDENHQRGTLPGGDRGEALAQQPDQVGGDARRVVAVRDRPATLQQVSETREGGELPVFAVPRHRHVDDAADHRGAQRGDRAGGAEVGGQTGQDAQQAVGLGDPPAQGHRLAGPHRAEIGGERQVERRPRAARSGQPGAQADHERGDVEVPAGVIQIPADSEHRPGQGWRGAPLGVAGESPGQPRLQALRQLGLADPAHPVEGQDVRLADAGHPILPHPSDMRAEGVRQGLALRDAIGEQERGGAFRVADVLGEDEPGWGPVAVRRHRWNTGAAARFLHVSPHSCRRFVLGEGYLSAPRCPLSGQIRNADAGPIASCPRRTEWCGYLFMGGKGNGQLA